MTQLTALLPDISPYYLLGGWLVFFYFYFLPLLNLYQDTSSQFWKVILVIFLIKLYIYLYLSAVK